MRLYFETARKAFQRGGAYRLATLTGILVNGFFGYIHSYVFIAVYSTSLSRQVAGFSLVNAISYTWFAQSMISVSQIWFDKEISQTILTGEVVSDFSKPFDYQTFWFSRFAGNSFFFLIFRGIPTYSLGLVFFGARLPSDLFAIFLFLVSLTLSIGVSFLTGYLVNLTAFWTISAAGTFTLAATIQMFFSGFLIPLSFMPNWLANLANWLPFQAIINTPAKIFLLQDLSWGLLLPQLAWFSLLWGLAQAFTRLARRKVNIQGG